MADLRLKGVGEMNGEDKRSEVEKDENLGNSSAGSEHDERSGKKEKPIEEEKLSEEEIAEIEENPDLEDPRLYSPLQEPDRPDPSLRTHEEHQESEHDEAQESPHPKE